MNISLIKLISGSMTLVLTCSCHRALNYLSQVHVPNSNLWVMQNNGGGLMGIRRKVKAHFLFFLFSTSKSSSKCSLK